MDFSTIKQKLNSNQYGSMKDFLDDLQLVFNNCIMYNGEHSAVSLMCKAVRDEFHKLYTQLCIDYYLWIMESKTVNEKWDWLLIN
jgi:hypothetical protein